MEYEIITTIAMLIAFSILGTIRNSLTLYFFVCKPTTVPHIFIRTLATVDLVTCLTTIPITIHMEYIYFQTDSIFLCWAYGFLSPSTISFAMMFMVQIAVDRCISLCRPLSQRMTERGAYATIPVVTLSSISLGILQMLTRNMEVFIIGDGNYPSSMNGKNMSLIILNSPNYVANYCVKSYDILSPEFINGFNIFYAGVTLKIDPIEK